MQSGKGPSFLRTLFPLTAFKNAPNPQFVQNLSRRLFFGVPTRGTQICQIFAEKLKNDNFWTNFQIFGKFLTSLGPRDWNPKTQSSGQTLDKFGVQGVFECCKGEKSSQHHLVFCCFGLLRLGQGCRSRLDLVSASLMYQGRSCAAIFS